MAITLKNLHVEIPIYLQGYDRLLKRPSFLTRSVGSSVNLSTKQLSITALENFNLDIPSGGRIGLLGHNGAGKTTLLKTIAGIIPYSSGDLIVNGNIGCVFDNGSGFSNELTGREIIKYYCKIYYPNRSYESIFVDILEFTELGDYIDLPLRVYSAGMHARLFAALSTATTNEILLIDEGIGAGDMAFQKKFVKRLDNYLRNTSTIILASHSLELMRDYCDQGVIMKRGAKIYQGSINDAIEIYQDGNN
jgi:ABC-2 type transport system ATP-binding protein/lipopolysaccharide transport system ATP-binding protein